MDPGWFIRMSHPEIISLPTIDGTCIGIDPIAAMKIVF